MTPKEFEKLDADPSLMTEEHAAHLVDVGLHIVRPTSEEGRP
jgi:hypothetical protein